MTAKAPGATRHGDGRVGAIAQSIVLVGLLAGAGLLAVTAASGGGREAPEGEYARHRSSLAPGQPIVVVEPAPRLRLILIVESHDRANALDRIGSNPATLHGRPAGDIAIEAAVITNEADCAAFVRAENEAAAICEHEDCPVIRVLDLRPPG